MAVILATAAAGACKCGPNLAKAEPAVSINLSSLDFGKIPVLNVETLPACDTCLDGGVVLDSIGTADLTVSALTITPAGSPFSVDPLEGNQLVIASGQFQGIPVHFEPTAQQCYSGTLEIQDDDAITPSNDTLKVALTGCGSTEACITTDPAVNFGLVCQSLGAIQKLTITAGCSADLIINSISFEPSSLCPNAGVSDGGATPCGPFAFVGSTKTPATVPVGQQTFLTIAFQPQPDGGATESTTIDIASTDPMHQLVKIPVTANVNFPPVPVIATPPNIAPGQTITLDGTGTTDPGNHPPLTCNWSMDSKPFGSAATPTPASGMTTQVTFDQPGPYTPCLVCTDALGCPSGKTCLDLVAKPSEKLVVEMVWDNDVTDMDLHFLAPGGMMFSNLDCWWGNPTPTTFGIMGDPTTDPIDSRCPPPNICNGDALEGPGPEYVWYPNPFPTSSTATPVTYNVDVHFYKTNGATNPVSNVTIRIFEYGLDVAEFKQQLTAAGQKWNACTVEWPSGTVTAGTGLFQ
jgi:hypothetical protein